MKHAIILIEIQKRGKGGAIREAERNEANRKKEAKSKVKLGAEEI